MLIFIWNFQVSPLRTPQATLQQALYIIDRWQHQWLLTTRRSSDLLPDGWRHQYWLAKKHAATGYDRDEAARIVFATRNQGMQLLLAMTCIVSDGDNPVLVVCSTSNFWQLARLLSSWIWCPIWKVVNISGLLMLRHSSFHQHNRSTLGDRGCSSLECLSVCTLQ